jgi:hypothetical protein
MIITSIEELRLAAPAHAYDSIDTLVGFIDNSEHEFLAAKLGQPLYEELCKWYESNRVLHTTVEDYQTGYFNRLLLICQRCVAFDALGRSAGMQTVSANASGINQFSAEGYDAADAKAVETYRKTCFTEALKSCDRLLTQLEEWTKQVASTKKPSAIDKELKTITDLWRQSRYFYLAASLFIPSATVLQQYIDFHESREKFICMLPDLRFIQEEQIAPAIGEDFCDWLVEKAIATVNDGTPVTSQSDISERIIHKLRKAIAALLEGRSRVLDTPKERRPQAHDDGVRMLQGVVDYIRSHQDDILTELGADKESVFKSSPLYVAPEAPAPADTESTTTCDKHCHQASKDAERTYVKGDPAAWTPPLF